jgi:glutathione S-transferase
VDGFVHLCTADQLTGVLQRFYPHGDVVILALAEAALGGRVRDEDLYGHGAFPHLYGPIPALAVLQALPLPAGNPMVTAPALLAALPQHP